MSRKEIRQKKKSKMQIRKALLISALSTMMCLTMLLGTTFAWFTDTASTSVNTVNAGDLKLGLEYAYAAESSAAEDTATWHPVKGIRNNTAILKDVGTHGEADKAWEPGLAKYVQLKVKNDGNLSLKYRLGLVFEEESGKNAEGDSFKLSDTLKAAILNDAQSFESSEAAISAVKDKAEILSKGCITGGNLYPKQETGVTTAHNAEGTEGTGNRPNEEIITIVVYYPEENPKGTSVANESSAPNISIGVRAFAGQLADESDSNGKSYDADATFLIEASNAIELTQTIRDANAGDTIKLTNNITDANTLTIKRKLTIDLNGKTLASTESNAIKLETNADLTITDSSVGETGKITNSYSGSNNSTTIDIVGKGAIFTLLSGIVETNAKDDLYTVAIGSSKKKACTVNIAGGTVTVPAGHEKSRAIHASNGMNLNISGGEIIGGVYGIDVYAGSMTTITGGKVSANAVDGRTDEYGTSYAIHAKGEASLTIGSLDAVTMPEVKGIKFESSGVNTELPTINLVKGSITNPIYSMEAKYNYELFKLGIVAGAPVTFADNTAHFFLADDLQMVQDGSVWKVTAK